LLIEINLNVFLATDYHRHHKPDAEQLYSVLASGHVGKTNAGKRRLGITDANQN